LVFYASLILVAPLVADSAANPRPILRFKPQPSARRDPAFIREEGNPLGSQIEFVQTHESASRIEVKARMPSEVKAISPMVDRVTRVIEESHCVLGEEPAIGLALREALNNAVLHGNRLDPCKLVRVHCRCERGKGVSLVIKDQGGGFDPGTIPDPAGVWNLEAEDGRGIYLMRWLMDEVSFEFGYSGTEVHMHKRLKGDPYGREK
jgi:serine/threonine-protein kinase RsbW